MLKTLFKISLALLKKLDNNMKNNLTKRFLNVILGTNMRHQTKEHTMSITYETKFNLTSEVNDFIEAYDYLAEDDMTQYLDEKFKNIVESIEWVLKTTDSGIIVVSATRELTDEESKELSEWISGQNSDGLGEGFEQQDFALTEEEYDDEDEENDEYEPAHYMASFDWTTNTYPLTKTTPIL